MGVLTSKNAIKKLSIKLDEYSGNYLTAIACVDKLKIAWKEYQDAKKEAAALRRAVLKGKSLKRPTIRGCRPKTWSRYFEKSNEQSKKATTCDRSEGEIISNQS